MYDIFLHIIRERDITPYKVSKDTGISNSTLCDWKRGRSTPKVDKLIVIADYLGISLSYLMTGEG